MPEKKQDKKKLEDKVEVTPAPKAVPTPAPKAVPKKIEVGSKVLDEDGVEGVVKSIDGENVKVVYLNRRFKTHMKESLKLV